jgi:ribonuclease HI
MVRTGVKLVFTEKPPLSREPIEFPPTRDPVKRQALRDCVRRMLKEEAVEIVVKRDSPGFYNHMFVTPKSTPGEWRPITNLSTLNTYLYNHKFEMESALSIQRAVEPGQWLTGLDLKDSYWQVKVHKASRKYLRFMLDGVVYQHTTLVFGLASAPRIFTELVEVLMNYARSRGIVIHAYLDDWIIRCLIVVNLLRQTQEVLQVANALGMLVNWAKSHLRPTQDLTFVGVRYMLELGLAVVPVVRIEEKLEPLLEKLLRKKWLIAAQWKSLIGTMSSMMRQIPLGRLRMRPIQWHLATRWRPSRDSPYTKVHLTEDLIQHLNWWRSRENVLEGMPLESFKETVQIFTDASSRGWGGHLAGNPEGVQGLWQESDVKRDINWKELKAVLLTLLELKDSVKNQKVLVATDNSTVVSYINKQGGMISSQLMTLTWELYSLTSELNCQLRARHVPGRLNMGEDILSRGEQVITTEWSLHQEVAEQLWFQWGKPEVDLFATRFNRKLEKFVSPMPDELAWGVDALTMNWTGLRAYAYPPGPILPEVLRKIREQPCTVVLIAPWKSERPWFPLLLQLLTAQPWKLPVRADLLSQPHSGAIDSAASQNLHAWKLSSQGLGMKATRPQ